MFFILGIFIYLLFRDMNNLLFIRLIPKLEFTKKVFMQLTPSIVSNIFIYNIPDMLWFISGISLIRFIWFYQIKEQNVYILCFYSIGFIFEICQLSNCFPGTFDYFDLFFMGIGAFVESVIYYKFTIRSFR